MGRVSGPLRETTYPRSGRLIVMVQSTLLLPAGCDPNPAYTHIDATVSSPDGTLDAIFAIDTGGGAAVGTSFDVYVVERNHYPRRVDRVFRNECVRDVSVKWDGPRLLLISYSVGANNRHYIGRDKPFPWFISWFVTRSPADDIGLHFAKHVSSLQARCR